MRLACRTLPWGQAASRSIRRRRPLRIWNEPLNGIAGPVDRELAVTFDLAFLELECQHTSLRGAFHLKLTVVAVGPGDGLTLLLELDDADRRTPFALEWVTVRRRPRRSTEEEAAAGREEQAENCAAAQEAL